MNTSKLATYSPEDVNVYVMGMIQISGFSSNTLVKIDRVNSYFKTKEYPDGTVVRSFTNSGLYRVSFVLSSASDSNNVLTTIASIDRETLLGKFPLIIKDSSGESIFFSASCWIESMPNLSYSVDITEREWIIMAPNASSYVGGNYRDSGIVEDIVGLFLGG